ncbi:hypothetical protein GCM10011351_29800 [Paraliobacillus quinghaiensis]|uniref:OsmC family peroxiredoxin n=1 Tax=Paraliobacillus quinghaiensis TaxID=470815 RepID=A0A917TWC7_9BACI|nr:OsmC family protein [Paraliobacillus quinghaiensis]GGM41718.1 hypothetical protein GCM10011351_29800 [Paraliobacillus quinghaiensis]
MITLKKTKDNPHQITNGKGVLTTGTASTSEEEGYTPVDYLTSSVSICMGLTLDALIKRDELPVDGYTINVSAKKAEGRPSRMESIDVEIDFDANLDAKTKDKLIKSAKRGCTIGNTIEQGAAINYTVK